MKVVGGAIAGTETIPSDWGWLVVAICVILCDRLNA